MNEQDWLTSDDPVAMFKHLFQGALEWPKRLQGRPGAVSERKLRLFACACCRQVWDNLADDRSRKAVEVAERFADGLATETECVIGGHGFVGLTDASAAASWAVAHSGCPVGIQAALLRDIIGNPFRPLTCGWEVIRGAVHMSTAALESGATEERIWRADWQITQTVIHLAQSIYDDRAFDRMAALADASEEAGCVDAAILEHCRGQECPDCQQGWVSFNRGASGMVCKRCAGTGRIQTQTHARGCWVLDLFLGKE